MNTVQFIKCVHMYLSIYIYICTKPMAVHMSGLYTKHIMVFGVWAGTNGHMLPMQYTTYLMHAA